MSDRLEQPREGKLIAGGCAAVARRYDWNAGTVPLLFTLFALVRAGEVVSVALWILMSKAPAPGSRVERLNKVA
jgi:phage shock protein C